MTTAKKVKVRFAPSPTGDLHVGNIRTALFDWAYARHTGGTFLFRIEDTDTTRVTDEYIQAAIDTLKWLGLQWDEGPEVGGPNGPRKREEKHGRQTGADAGRQGHPGDEEPDDDLRLHPGADPGAKARVGTERRRIRRPIPGHPRAADGHDRRGTR